MLKRQNVTGAARNDAPRDYSAKRAAHWNSIAADQREKSHFAKAYYRQILRTYKFLVPKGSRILEIGCGDGRLLAELEPSMGVGIDFSEAFVSIAREKHKEVPQLSFDVMDAHDLRIDGQFDYIVISDLLDDIWDVQLLFEKIVLQVGPRARIVINSYSKLWEMPLGAARRFGLATPLLRQNWLSPHDISNIASLSGLEIIHSFPEVLLPVDLWGVSTLFNRFAVRLWPFRYLALCNFFIMRLKPTPAKRDHKVSVIVPARNEAGNIAAIIDRVPRMGRETEIIFVEGNSKDDTLSTITRELNRRTDVAIKLFEQDGKGKRNAVEKGFAEATGDVFMILDADISVLPEELYKFYRVWSDGTGEFINGVRLSYPMEGKAMRPLNLLGNRVFGAAISWVLGQKIQDTLCGTKVLHRDHYAAIAANRGYFGDFDPFGDFDLIFGAAKLNLKIVDLPVRYHERTYGQTNISRWSHGALLLKMIFVALQKFKFH